MGAPQTTLNISFPPTLTSQTFNLSALGCFSAFNILAILKSDSSSEFFFMPSTSVESQLASSTQAAFESGSAIGTSTGVVSPTLTTTAGSFNVPTALPSVSYATGTPAQQLAQTVPASLGIDPSVATQATQASNNYNRIQDDRR